MEDEENFEQKKNSKIKTLLNTKILIPIIGIIIGIATIVIGIINFNWSYSGTVSKTSYGGDAYTGIQNASAQTATNVYNTYSLIQDFSRTFFIIFGALIILHYIERLLDNIKLIENKKEK